MGQRIATARKTAGLSQSALARLSKVPQPNISAYEAGTRVPRPETLESILQATRRRPSVILFENRDAVHELAARRHISNVRVFGSSLRGEDTPESDVDLLVTAGLDATIFDVAGFEGDLRRLLEIDVDVVTDGGDNGILTRIKAEAVPL